MNIAATIIFAIAFAISQNGDAGNLQDLHKQNAELRKENIEQQVAIEDMKQRLEDLEIKYEYEVKR